MLARALENNPKVIIDQQQRTVKAIGLLRDAVSKLDRKGAALSGKRKFVFYDLSRQPLYDPLNTTQSQRLQKLSRKLDTIDSTSLSEVFVIDHHGCHSLFAKSQMEMELF